MKSNTAFSQFIVLYCTARYDGSFFDSFVIGDIIVHNKFTGIHIMDFHPLAGLASISLQLETSFKKFSSKGRKKGKGRNKRTEKENREKEKGKLHQIDTEKRAESCFTVLLLNISAVIFFLN
ncbi:hypothetical protein KIL84_016708 [Mauremys mutica]|uniref:Uncharacterized protein n=1 Tax=Mauremys mutica TaxID=74926 RepID=A0A9D3WZL5_9SAUR|nr:hypothetical protein KIL84_016708 [Mauremys mutica]